MEITFSVNRYDRDGDETEHGVFLHIGGTSVKVSDTVAGVHDVERQIRAICREVIENYTDYPPLRAGGYGEINRGGNMEIVLRHSDRFRIQTDQGNNFIDINGMEHEQGIRVEAYPHFHYIEMREKMGQVATFYFRNKGAKKHLDLGWWQDAEVVYAKNDVRK